MQGEVGVGAVAAASAMALRLNGIAHWIMWEVASLFEHVGTVEDGMRTLSRAHTVVDAPDAQPLRVTRGEIVFDHVTFAYGGKRAVVDDLRLHIRPGEKIGLVGRSGAGKSTIVNLLLRFYDVERGAILIDGQDIAHVTQDSLRAQIGMVTQDTSLLHRSVRDNIVYGRPDATDADMIAAARRAEAHEFIHGLSDVKGRRGYDAHVGERGVKLSGGQRQRIAIARVMLKDAPILLLDEATSALDSEVESRDPAEPVPADGRQDRRRHRPPPVHDRGDGPSRRHGQGPHRRGRRPSLAARAGRAVRAPVGAPERRLPRRGDRRRRGSRDAAPVC